MGITAYAERSPSKTSCKDQVPTCGQLRTNDSDPVILSGLLWVHYPSNINQLCRPTVRRAHCTILTGRRCCPGTTSTTIPRHTFTSNNSTRKFSALHPVLLHMPAVDTDASLDLSRLFPSSANFHVLVVRGTVFAKATENWHSRGSIY